MYYTDEELEALANDMTRDFCVFFEIYKRGIYMRSEDPNTRYIKKYPYDAVHYHNNPVDKRHESKKLSKMKLEERKRQLAYWHSSIGQPIDIEAHKKTAPAAV